MEPITRLLALGRRSNRALDRAGGDVILALHRIPDHHIVCRRGAPIDAKRAKQIVEWRRCERSLDGTGDRIPLANERTAILIPHFERSESKDAVGDERATKREGDLLAIEWRIPDFLAVEQIRE